MVFRKNKTENCIFFQSRIDNRTEAIFWKLHMLKKNKPASERECSVKSSLYITVCLCFCLHVCIFFICSCVCGQLLKNPDREREHREKSSRGVGLDDSRKSPSTGGTARRDRQQDGQSDRYQDRQSDSHSGRPANTSSKVWQWQCHFQMRFRVYCTAYAYD